MTPPRNTGTNPGGSAAPVGPGGRERRVTQLGGSQGHPGSGRPRKTAHTQTPWERKGPKQRFPGPGRRIPPNQGETSQAGEEDAVNLCTKCQGAVVTDSEGDD